MGMENADGSQRSMANRAVSAATLGTALEWFDFTLYGSVAATVLPKLFFPSMEPNSALLASLATFSVGLAARPLGAIICGHFGDKIGRRNLMLGTVSVMGITSVLMGLLPTYLQIGMLAPILLVVLRIIQGFALGGESTGGQLMALEHAPADRRGKYSGLIGMCAPLSQILANAVLLILSATMSADAFTSYGWRIPFVMSFLLVIVGIYIRLRVSETPAFVQMKQSAVANVSSPLKDAFRLHYKTIIRMMLFFCGPTALFYLAVVFTLGYLTNSLGVPKQTGFTLLMIGNACAIAGSILGGLLSDRIGRKRALLIASAATFVIMMFYFPLLATKNFATMAIAMGLFMGFVQVQTGIQPVAFAEAFPTNVRYSGSALAFTGASLFAGGPIPVVATWLLNLSHGSPWTLVALVASLNALSFCMIAIGPETKGIDINRLDSTDDVIGKQNSSAHQATY
ncbi:MFS transporter [Caballeronia sp. GAWG1-1]|uniref:MFS transporter n=1 Tax=Caballeronia sp. GAWG1-1 TaxID=2921742 RepID=UPI002029608A|nr:MFS transporter [Caballeronia sp. GAWG1-1]